jgi:hypothetical protein
LRVFCPFCTTRGKAYNYFSKSALSLSTLFPLILGKRTSANCPTSGFHPLGQASCVCNFAGACTPGTTTHTTTASNDPTNLAGIAPRGLDMLAYGTQNLGTVCEGGVVAALYDCNARTSLYAATVIDGPNANGMLKHRQSREVSHISIFSASWTGNVKPE